MILSVFPAWFPTDAVLLGMVALSVAILLMNRSRMRMVKVVAQGEALIVGFGVMVAAASSDLSAAIGMGSSDMYLVAGLAIALLGVLQWRNS